MCCPVRLQQVPLRAASIAWLWHDCLMGAVKALCRLQAQKQRNIEGCQVQQATSCFDDCSWLNCYTARPATFPACKAWLLSIGSPLSSSQY